MMRNIIISMLLCLMVTVANADVIAHWSFNDQADPWHDDSGNGHDGTTPLGVPQWNEGGTVTFDGIDDFVDFGEFVFGPGGLSESFEVEVRFKNPSIGVGEAILGYNAGGGHTVNPAGVFMIGQNSDFVVSEVMDDVYTGGWNSSRVNSIDSYVGGWCTVKVKRDVSSDTFSLEIRNDSGVLCEPIISTEDLTTPTDKITLNHFAVGCQYTEAKANGYWDGFSGTIDYVTITTEPTIDSIINFIFDSIDTETLQGEGAGKSADNKLNAFISKIDTAAFLIDAGDPDSIVEACGELRAAYKKCDGVSPPPDFVSGDAREQLAGMILDLIEELGCE